MTPLGPPREPRASDNLVKTIRDDVARQLERGGPGYVGCIHREHVLDICRDLLDARARLAKVEQERDAAPLTFRRLQDEQRPWVAHNFAGRHPFYPLLGAMEELGELAHAHLKGLQGIRHTPNEIHAMKIDAVADIIVFLSDYATANDIDLQDAIESTWAKVRQRDWKADPINALAESSPPTTTTGEGA